MMIRPLVDSTLLLRSSEIEGKVDLIFATIDDEQNVGVLVGIWLSVAFVYFIDLQVRIGGSCTT